MTMEQRPSPKRRRGHDPKGRGVYGEEAETVLAACRVLVALSAQSIAAVENVADLTQVRVLVIVASRGSVSLGALADAAHIHLSKASRVCDRLVSMKLLNRADDPTDRRQLTLTLTAKGRQVVQTVTSRRRAAIGEILARMPQQRRTDLVSALREFADAGEDPSPQGLWSMGWTT